VGAPKSIWNSSSAVRQSGDVFFRRPREVITFSSDFSVEANVTLVLTTLKQIPRAQTRIGPLEVSISHFLVLSRIGPSLELYDADRLTSFVYSFLTTIYVTERFDCAQFDQTGVQHDPIVKFSRIPVWWRNRQYLISSVAPKHSNTIIDDY
jgi:hypothetical protein